jgi:hypothetical protein
VRLVGADFWSMRPAPLSITSNLARPPMTAKLYGPLAVALGTPARSRAVTV